MSQQFEMSGSGDVVVIAGIINAVTPLYLPSGDYMCIEIVMGDGELLAFYVSGHGCHFKHQVIGNDVMPRYGDRVIAATHFADDESGIFLVSCASEVALIEEADEPDLLREISAAKACLVENFNTALMGDITNKRIVEIALNIGRLRALDANSAIEVLMMLLEILLNCVEESRDMDLGLRNLAELTCKNIVLSSQGLRTGTKICVSSMRAFEDTLRSYGLGESADDILCAFAILNK